MRTQLWEPLQDEPETGRVQCRACAHYCKLAPGATGRCGVRANTGGVLSSLVLDGVVAAHVDPVEKKPLYHFLPGTRIFSFGTEGCNFRCAFCQNADISQHPRLTGQVRRQPATPVDLIRAAWDARCESIAFTYTEPTIFIELTLESAAKAQEAGLGVALVSNGYQSPESLEALKPYIQAANIDLKSMRPDFYTRQCGGRLQPVLENLRRMREYGWWLEITTLVIPGINDTPEELDTIARFIAGDLGEDTPWHVSAFHPAFEMRDRPGTSADRIELACTIGQKAGLRFVYPGNILTNNLKALRNTSCPRCGTVCIERFSLPSAGFEGFCRSCGYAIPGIWS